MSTKTKKSAKKVVAEAPTRLRVQMSFNSDPKLYKKLTRLAKQNKQTSAEYAREVLAESIM